MAQRVFTFHSPVEPQKTIEIISEVVTKLKGRIKVEGLVATAKWWSKGATTLPHKFKFYIGKDIVRVVTGDMNSAYQKIKWEFRCNPVLKLWNVFVKELTHLYPDLSFEISCDEFQIVSAKILSDGIEQTFSSKSVTKPSIGGALLGGALFGDVGAIIGGSRTKTHTTGTSTSTFSSDVLVRVRYSNGFNLEGTISKKSLVYNSILVGLSDTSDI